MSNCQMSNSRKRNFVPEGVDGNILGHNRRSENPDPSKKIKVLETLCALCTKITCLDFGPDQKSLFPKHFFCHECKDWENCNRMQKRLHLGMKKYQCRVNHQSILTPTIKPKKRRPSKQMTCCTECSTSPPTNKNDSCLGFQKRKTQRK